MFIIEQGYKAQNYPKMDKNGFIEATFRSKLTDFKICTSAASRPLRAGKLKLEASKLKLEACKLIIKLDVKHLKTTVDFSISIW